MILMLFMEVKAVPAMGMVWWVMETRQTSGVPAVILISNFGFNDMDINVFRLQTVSFIYTWFLRYSKLHHMKSGWKLLRHCLKSTIVNSSSILFKNHYIKTGFKSWILKVKQIVSYEIRLKTAAALSKNTVANCY